MKKAPPSPLSLVICFGLFELLFLTPLVFYGWATTFSVTKESFAQIGFLVLILIWVVGLSRDLSEKRESFLLTPPFSIPIIIFGLILIFSLIWSSSLYPSFLSLGVWGVFFSVYFLTLWAVRDKKWVELLLIAVVGAGFIAAGYSILQFYGVELPIWRKVMGRMRLFSTFGNPNYLADYLAASLHLGVLLFLIQKRIRFFWLLVVATLYTSLILTYTRGAWVAIFLSGIFVFILLFIYGKKFLLSQKLPIVLVMLVLLSITLIFSFPNPLNLKKRSVFERGTSIVHLKSSASQRILIWMAAVEMIKERPFLGWGVGNFGVHYPEAQGKILSRIENRDYIPQANRSTRAHNDYLQIWAETGLFGIVLFFWIIVSFYREIFSFLKRKGVKNLSSSSLFLVFFAGASTSFLIHATVSFPFHIVQNGMVFWLILALTGKIIKGKISWEEKGVEEFNKDEDFPEKKLSFRSFRKPLIWIFLTLIFAGAFYLSLWRVKIFLSDINVKKAELLIEAGFYSAARDELYKAVKINPYNAQAFAYLTQVDSYLGVYPEIIKAAEKAYPNWNIAGIHNRKAFAYLKLGKIDETAKALDRCIFLYPNFAAGYINYGYLNLLKGEENIRKGNLLAAEKNLDDAFLFYVQGKIWKKDFTIPQRLSLAYYNLINKRGKIRKGWSVKKTSPSFLFYSRDDYFIFVLPSVAKLGEPFGIFALVWEKENKGFGKEESTFSFVARIEDKEKVWWEKKIVGVKLSSTPLILKFNVGEKLPPRDYTISARLISGGKLLTTAKQKFTLS